jgi:hypothetical protein
MSEVGTSRPHWNLFARELDDILLVPQRNVRLSQIRYQAGIHQEKVRRLCRSLERPKSFPTLNPTEMDKVIKTYQLTPDEVLRLRAAILATAIEKLLMDRLDHIEDALHAAEQIFPILVEALRSGGDEPPAVGGFTWRRLTMTQDNEDTETDLALELALEALDRATLALNLSHHVGASTERVERARQARDAFQSSLDELDELAEQDASYRQNEAWQEWRAEADAGYRTASQRLADLGK